MEHAEFDAKVARALIEAGRDVDEHWPHRRITVLRPGGVSGADLRYTLADPAPLTDEQAEAAAKAGACFVGLGGSAIRSFRDGVGWCHWRNGSWSGPDAFNAPARGCEYVLAPDPSRAAEDEPAEGSGYTPGERQCVAAEDEPEPQDTLLACMRWCKENETAARAKSFALEGVDIDSCGDIYAIRSNVLWIEMESLDWQLSTDEGATWFSPSTGPEVEPKSGAELRRWLVSNPGREAVDDDGDLYRWNAEESAFELFESRYGGHWKPGQEATYEFLCIPADGGTWESEGE